MPKDSVTVKIDKWRKTMLTNTAFKCLVGRSICWIFRLKSVSRKDSYLKHNSCLVKCTPYKNQPVIFCHVMVAQAYGCIFYDWKNMIILTSVFSYCHILRMTKFKRITDGPSGAGGQLCLEYTYNFLHRCLCYQYLNKLVTGKSKKNVNKGYS